MSRMNTPPRTVNAGPFNPDELFEQWGNGNLSAPQGRELQPAVKRLFDLKENDTYVYHAVMGVSLAEVQEALNHGRKSGLHTWYLDEEGQPITPPSQSDIEAYVSVFSSTTSTSKALTSLEKNAKKDSARSRVATNLIAKRTFSTSLAVPKLRSPQVNPYFDFWAWSCSELEWGGPDNSTVNVKRSHHVLPILYHHFGCVCPSFEGLEAIRQVAKNRPVFDLGSGNGYWTYMLRRMGLSVQAVDNGDSLWRTTWIGDTVKSDGAKFLQKQDGGRNGVLLLVYPQVTTHFTKSVLEAYVGDSICVAGTQNENGFTGFKEMTFDKYMMAQKPDYKKIVQTPLPSFAAKDEALYIFQRSG